jgi:hypothetical protein
MDEGEYQMSSIVIKDSYKADVFNFDMECWKQEIPNKILFNEDGTVKDGPCTKWAELYNLTINNVISWEWTKMKLTRNELKGLADFLNQFLEDNP